MPLKTEKLANMT